MIFVGYGDGSVVLMGGPFGTGVRLTEAEMQEIIGNVLACKQWKFGPDPNSEDGFYVVRQEAGG